MKARRNGHLSAFFGRIIGFGPRVYFVVHNANHVRMFAQAECELRKRGFRTKFCVPMVFVHAPYALDELARRGLAAHPLDDMIATANTGDAVVVGLDGTPGKLKQAIAAFDRRGIATIGVIEGARFPKQTAFRNVRHVMVWGPSGVDAYGDRAIVTGATVIEDMQNRDRTGRNPDAALVNYKFTWQDKESDPGHLWLRSVQSILTAEGFKPVFSCHPAETHLVPGIEWSRLPFEDLIMQTALVVTRSSTAIYQALAAGSQPFLFKIANEELLELADPMSAFSVVSLAAGLRLAISRWKSGSVRYSADAFMARNVSLLPKRPAHIRLAEEIACLTGAGRSKPRVRDPGP